MANLWAGSAGATATPHYDAYHNIHVQVREGCPSCCVDPSLCETQWVHTVCVLQGEGVYTEPLPCKMHTGYACVWRISQGGMGAICRLGGASGGGERAFP